MYSANLHRSLICLLVILSSSFLLISCQSAGTKDNYGLSLTQLYQHMAEKTGCTFLRPMNPGPIYAESGFVVQIGGREVAFYKYNTARPGKQNDKLQYVRDRGYIYIIGYKKSAITNGSFIMVDYDTNEKKDELVKAFMSF